MADIPLFFFVERVFCLWGFYLPPLGRALKKAPGAEWKETAGQALTSSLRMSTTNGSDKLTSLPVGRWLMVRRLNVTYELVVSTLVKGVCILCILLESTWCSEYELEDLLTVVILANEPSPSSRYLLVRILLASSLGICIVLAIIYIYI